MATIQTHNDLDSDPFHIDPVQKEFYYREIPEITEDQRLWAELEVRKRIYFNRKHGPYWEEEKKSKNKS